MNEQKKLSVIVKYMIIAALLLLGVKYFEHILGFSNELFSVISPLVLGGAIAYILNILVTALEKIYFSKSTHQLASKTKRPVCIILSLLIIIGIAAIIFVIVIPQLIGACKVLFDSIPGLVLAIQERIEHLSLEYPALQEYTSQLNVDTQSLIKSTLNGISALLSGIFSSSIMMAGTVTGWIVNFVIGLIFAIYLLLSKEKLQYQTKKVMQAFLNVKHRNIIYITAKVANESFTSYITGQCMEAIILGTLCAIGMWIFRFPYAGMIGTFIGATALIPIVGAYIGATLGVIMILTVSPVQALLFIVYILVLQQLENTLIYPKIVGSSIGLPGMWVLAAVTIGGGLGGILGMIIGVPLTATAYKLMKMVVNRRLAAEK